MIKIHKKVERDYQGYGCRVKKAKKFRGMKIKFNDILPVILGLEMIVSLICFNPIVLTVVNLICMLDSIWYAIREKNATDIGFTAIFSILLGISFTFVVFDKMCL